jgi:hypothetical protein
LIEVKTSFDDGTMSTDLGHTLIRKKWLS